MCLPFPYKKYRWGRKGGGQKKAMPTLNSQETIFSIFFPSQIHTVPPLLVVTMYNYHPRLLAKSNIEKQYFSHCVSDVCATGRPPRIRRVLLISFGMTILPKSSTRRTMPAAFIILFSFEARDARFAPVEVFAGKGELCIGALQSSRPDTLALCANAAPQGSS